MKQQFNSNFRNPSTSFDDLLSFRIDALTTAGKWWLALCFILMSSGVGVWAQDNQSRSVSGVVTDASTGETLPGVNIIISGTTSGTVSNMDGEYIVQVSGEGSVLTFSFIGYVKQDVVVGNQ